MFIKYKKFSLKNSLLSIVFISLLTSCNDPRKVEVHVKEKKPETKSTVYSDAIRKMGMMNVIYDTYSLKIMTNDISDNTGSGGANKYEIPRDITEMVRSALNSIGGNILYIPYDPGFMQNNMTLGYSQFKNKVIPDVVVSGGITEYDRALSKSGDGINIDLAATIGTTKTGLTGENENSTSTSRVTLDFNLVDFQTFTGIPRMQAVNSIEVTNAKKKNSFGFSIAGATFGAQGNMQKIQGRHAAVRLLVELSMIQLVGRMQLVPYWNIVPGTRQDQVVMDQVIDNFYNMNDAQKITKMQEYLFLIGYELDLNGETGPRTVNALNDFAQKNSINGVGVNEATYIALFEAVPVNRATKHRRDVLNQKLADEAAKLADAAAAKLEAARLAAELADASASDSMAANSARAAAEEAAKAVAAANIAKMMEQQNEQKPEIKKIDQSLDTGQLTLWTDKQNYSIGETMTINFSVDEPMFVRLVIINSKGEVSTLFPNPMQSDNFLKPGNTYSIPPKGAEFTLDIGEPIGTDFVKGVASKKPVPAGAIFFKGADFDSEKMKQFPVRASVPVIIRN